MQPPNMQPIPDQNMNNPPPLYPPPKERRGLRSLVVVLFFLFAAGVILNSPLFQIERVIVIGCVNIPESKIVEVSGLYPGQNMLSVNKETIEKSINADRYLLYQDLKKDYTTRTATLYVYERIPVATLQTLGIQYTLDAMGVVLEQTEELSLIDGLIVLTGLKADACILGSRVVAQQKGQLDAYQAVMYELNALSSVGLMSELNVLDMGNLYLVSADGMAVRLGDAQQIHAKIISFFTVKEQLDLMGKTGGTVDVSIPVYPVYIP